MNAMKIVGCAALAFARHAGAFVPAQALAARASLRPSGSIQVGAWSAQSRAHVNTCHGVSILLLAAVRYSFVSISFAAVAQHVEQWRYNDVLVMFFHRTVRQASACTSWHENMHLICQRVRTLHPFGQGVSSTALRMVSVGQAPPDFSLMNQNNKPVSLSSFKKKKSVVVRGQCTTFHCNVFVDARFEWLGSFFIFFMCKFLRAIMIVYSKERMNRSLSTVWGNVSLVSLIILLYY